MTQPSDPVVAFLRACGVDLERSPLQVMRRLYADLLAANREDNLTRITAEADFWVKHVADSVAVGLAVPGLVGRTSRSSAGETGEAIVRVADVGCGAGFPLLPLAWASPALSFTGFESRGKKADFVSREIRRLGLGNAHVVSRRAREAGRLPEHAGQYDVVLLRAVGAAGEMVRGCRALLREEPGARMVHYKTPDGVAAEQAMAEREAGKYGLAVETSQTIELPGEDGERQFLLLRRI